MIRQDSAEQRRLAASLSSYGLDDAITLSSLKKNLVRVLDGLIASETFSQSGRSHNVSIASSYKRLNKTQLIAKNLFN